MQKYIKQIKTERKRQKFIKRKLARLHDPTFLDRVVGEEYKSPRKSLAKVLLRRV